MKVLGQLDLYTVLILICVVLLPVCGWWAYQTNEEIKSCERAKSAATRRGGVLETIGSLQKQIEMVNGSSVGLTRQPRSFFNSQILSAAVNGGLAANDYSLLGPKEVPARIPGSKQRVVDHVMTVAWRNKELPVQLDLIQAILWNIESGATRPGSTQAVQSVWRLRTLKLANVTGGDKRTFAQFRTPPPELEDRWLLEGLEFARREPKKN